MKQIKWQNIDTVLLDMDGTLLDLHFDNQFWQNHVPRRYAEQQGISIDEAHTILVPRFAQMEGKLEWYCVDYWSDKLSLDIMHLKKELMHLIAVHPHVPEFLTRLKQQGKRVVLVTNAHHKTLAFKMNLTHLEPHFDNIISSHSLGLPKEEPDFWSQLQELESFDPARTVLVDDSLPVLRSARQYGIAYLYAIYCPDSQASQRPVGDFQAIHTFDEIMPRCKNVA